MAAPSNGHQGKALQYKYRVTIFNFVVIVAALTVLVFSHTEMSALEGALFGTVIGAIAAGWKDSMSFWFRDPERADAPPSAEDPSDEPKTIKQKAIDEVKRRLPHDY